MMDPEVLKAEILKQRPDLTEETLNSLIQEKKSRIGAGYLSDAGACWLVASDLGVFLERAMPSDLPLSDIYIGASEITVVGRILALYPRRVYKRKDGSEGYFRRIVLFDKSAFVKAVAWDEKSLLTEHLGLKLNETIRIVKGYVRAGLDGRPVLHIGSRGDIQVLDNGTLASKLPTLEAVSKDISQVNSAEEHLSVTGVVVSDPRRAEFIKRDGRQGNVLQFYMSSAFGNKTVRVAIWDNSSEPLLGLKADSSIRLVNVRSKLLPHGEIELHGDESMCATAVPMPEIHKVYAVADSKALRILSFNVVESDARGSTIASALATDSSGTLYTLTAKGDAYLKLLSIRADDLVRCRGKDAGQFRLFCEDFAPEAVESGDERMPSSTSFRYKISELANAKTPVFLKAIALSKVSVKDIITKDGSVVKRAEVTLGDETGEVKLVAWREQVKILEEILPGQCLFVRAVAVQKDRDSSLALQTRPYSSVERIA